MVTTVADELFFNDRITWELWGVEQKPKRIMKQKISLVWNIDYFLFVYASNTVVQFKELVRTQKGKGWFLRR